MFAIVILCLVATLVTGKPLRSADFDHYVFTQVYPAGMCFSYFGEVIISLFKHVLATSYLFLTGKRL